MCGVKFKTTPDPTGNNCFVCNAKSLCDDGQLTASPAVLNALENPVKGDLSEPEEASNIQANIDLLRCLGMDVTACHLNTLAMWRLKHGAYKQTSPSQVVLPREIVDNLTDSWGLIVEMLDGGSYSAVMGFPRKGRFVARGETPEAAISALAAALKDKEGM